VLDGVQILTHERAVEGKRGLAEEDMSELSVRVRYVHHIVC